MIQEDYMSKALCHLINRTIPSGIYAMHLHISHNAPYLPLKFCITLVFLFLLGITAVPREIENKAYAKFCWADKVNYGRFASGVLVGVVSK